MGNRRIGRKRLESALKKLNATTPDTAGSRSGKKGLEFPPWQLVPSKYWGFHDDFLMPSAANDLAEDEDLNLAHGADASGCRWDLTVATGGTVTLANEAYGVGGYVKITPSSSDTGAVSMEAVNNTFVLDASNARKLWWEAKLHIVDVDKCGIFVGLASVADAQDADYIGSIGGDADMIGFIMAAGGTSAVLNAIAKEGSDSTPTNTSTGTSLSDALDIVLSMHWDGSSVHYYINGTKTNSISSNLPNDGVLLFPVLEVEAEGTGQTGIVAMDYMRCCMER